jgi:hypothetical protein
MTDRTFDWISRHDPRSRAYPIDQLTTQPPRYRNWHTPQERIDQGREGACVGFAWTIELLCSPIVADVPRPRTAFAQHIYREAQKIDQWPGTDYEGTSILAGAQILQRLGYIESYWWAFGIDQVLSAISHIGPVVVGVPWFSGMYDTDPDGRVRVDGTHVGGHAICLTGYHPSHRGHDNTPLIRWRNSWGSQYGKRGNGLIHPNDLAWLLSHHGEACVPVVNSRQTVANPASTGDEMTIQRGTK